MNLMANPWPVLDSGHDWLKKSPITLILAVVFVLQPIISFILGLVQDYTFLKQKVDPGTRPVTVKELRLVDQKIDALEQMIQDDMKKDDAILKRPNVETFNKARQDLSQLQQQLDDNYKKHPSKK